MGAPASLLRATKASTVKAGIPVLGRLREGVGGTPIESEGPVFAVMIFSRGRELRRRIEISPCNEDCRDRVTALAVWTDRLVWLGDNETVTYLQLTSVFGVYDLLFMFRGIEEQARSGWTRSCLAQIMH